MAEKTHNNNISPENDLDLSTAEIPPAQNGSEDQTASQAEVQDGVAEEPDYAKIEKENQTLKDQYLRLAADMENLRRRTQRDIQDARLYSVTQFARDMLSVADNLERALAAVPQEASANDNSLETLVQGIKMVQSSMLSTLEQHGVKKLEPLGEKFDPNFHQAMFEVPDDNSPNNTIKEVVQAGFIIGNRVLRPALVGVSKASSMAKETTAPTDNNLEG